MALVIGAALPFPSTVQQPPQLSGYRISGPVDGRPALGWVATRAITGESVTIRIVSSGKGRADDAQALRARLEAALTWSIDHPHLLRVVDFGLTRFGATWIATERLGGETLEERLERVPSLPAGVVASIARQVARGLAAVHARGACHRELRPQNVLLTDTPFPDFVRLRGLAGAWLAPDDPARTMESVADEVVASLRYTAPEVFLGGTADARADLYALGATLYRALAGRPPIEADDPASLVAVWDAGAAIPSLPAMVPAPLAAAVRGLLHPDPGARLTLPALQARLEGFQPPRAGAATVMMWGRRTVEVPTDLKLPTLGPAGDHQRFRMHLLAAMTRVFPPGEAPESLSSWLSRVDRLGDEVARARQIAQDGRRAADEVAAELRGRAETILEALDEAEEVARGAESDVAALAAGVGQLAERLGDVDREYAAAWRTMESVNAAAAEEAARRGAAASLDGLFGEAIDEALEKLEGLRDWRDALVADRERQREAVVAASRVAAEASRRVAEVRHAYDEIDLERRARLLPLDAEARSEDEGVLDRERELEHAYLLLAAALRRELSGAPT